MASKIFAPLIAAGFGLSALATPAFAATSTMGCGGSADTCTLSQLFAGGSITVDDVNFGGAVFDAGNSASAGFTVDSANVDVTGASGPGGSVLFDFVLDPAIELTSIDTFVEYVFEAVATVIGGSGRMLVGLEVSFLGDFSVSGSANSFAEVQADNGMGGGPLALAINDVFADGTTDLQNPDGVAFGPNQMQALDLAFGAEVFDDAPNGAGSATFSGFRLAFLLEGDLPPPTADVPLPAALPLMMFGLAGLRFFSKKTKKA